MESKVDAVVLAGDGAGSKPVKEKNKAFLRINGKECLVYVVDSLFGSRTIDRVSVVGPEDRIGKLLRQSYSERIKSGKLNLVPQKANIIENVKAGFFSFISQPTSPEAFISHSLDHPAFAPFREKAILVLPSDIPFVLSAEIDQFITQADMTMFDYAIGLTEQASLMPFYPTPEKNGIKMSYFHTREGAFRQNNLHLGKLLKVPGLLYIDKVYRLRYQKKLFNMARMVMGLLRKGRAAMDALKIFLRLQMARYAQEHGKGLLQARFSDPISLKRILSVISSMLGAPTQVIITTFGGAALDMDNEADYEAAKEMFKEWMEYQQNEIFPS